MEDGGEARTEAGGRVNAADVVKSVVWCGRCWQRRDAERASRSGGEDGVQSVTASVQAAVGASGRGSAGVRGARPYESYGYWFSPPTSESALAAGLHSTSQPARRGAHDAWQVR